MRAIDDAPHLSTSPPPPPRGQRVLLVEDDEAMVAALCHGFEGEGFAIDIARNGIDGLHQARTAAPDIVILDVMMPKKNGLDVCRELRASGSDVPVIMLTARGQELDKVVGLRIGADDYVTKPFSFLELVARVEALLRRTAGTNERPPICRFGDVTIDFRRHETHRQGQPLELTAREFHLLDFFLRHQGEVVTREQLLDEVWGYDAIPITRTVDTHIAKLRKKIEPSPTNPRHIVTVHRMGYKFLG